MNFRIGWGAAAWWLLCGLLLGNAASAQLTFTQSFDPPIVAPESSSAAVFQISNPSPIGATDLTLTNVLPAGVVLATGANAFSTCTDLLISAPDGGSTITANSGRLAGGSSCIVRVDVVASIPGTYTNVSGDLTSSLGNSGPSTADLQVSNQLIFTKSFVPSAIQVGAVSRLTLSLQAPSGTIVGINVTDRLPAGLRVAPIPNLISNCNGTATAVPGSDVLTVISAFLLAPATCEIGLDVVASAAGRYSNRTDVLTSSLGTSGRANAVLDVIRSTLLKRFEGNVRPGDIVDLTFELRNYDRADALTNLSFTDDLSAMLAGAVAVGLPQSDVCGAGSQISGTTLLSLTGGSLPPSGSCTFTVPIQIPAGAAPGNYANTTSPINGLLSAAPFADVAASAELPVVLAPRLTKAINPSTARPGQTLSVDFTLTNLDTTNAATEIGFTDAIDRWFPTNGVSALPTPGFCNGAIATTFLSAGERILQVIGASLPPGGSCSFSVQLPVPITLPPGVYTNRTSNVTARLAGSPVEGRGAEADLTVVAAPRLSKAFLDDPVNAGDSVTLQFALTHAEASTAAATGISFTDDLNATLSGLVAVGLPQTDICGAGSQLSGSSVLSFSGGQLAAGETCIFTVTLQVPAAAAPGTHPNTTSAVSATVGGWVIADGPPATDNLIIQPLRATKSYPGSPIATSATSTTVQYTLENLSATSSFTNLTFSDNNPRILPTATPTGLPLMDVCGAGSVVSASGATIALTGGNLGPGSSCSFSVNLALSPLHVPGDYSVATSAISGLRDGAPTFIDGVAGLLQVVDPLVFAKRFTDDPVAAGGTVTLEFALSNNDTVASASNLFFVDDLNAVLPGLQASGLPLNDVCGAGSQLSGVSTLNLNGGNLAPGSSCVFSVTLQVPAAAQPGLYLNTTGTLFGALGGNSVTVAPASDTLLIRGSADFSKSFDGDSYAGGTPVLTFSITNNDAAPVSDLRFSDDLDAMLSGAMTTGPLPASPCGAGSSLSGGSVVSLTGGTLAAGASCSFNVSVAVPAGAVPGSYPNISGNLSAGGIAVAPPAMDALVVNPAPVFNKSFSPPTLFAGQSSTLQFVIDNSVSTIAASGLSFSDNLPAGMTVAAPAMVVNGCGGMLTATAGSGVISLSGGGVAAGASCTIAVDVVSVTPGAYLNTTGDLSSLLGNSGPASASWQVEPLPGFTKAFLADPIFVGQTTTLQFTISNTSALLALSGLSFVDNLPAGLVIGSPANAATTCTGGSLTAVSGTGAVSYSGGSLAPGASCTVSVDLQAGSAGLLTNTSGALTSNAGDSGSATATLQVNPLPQLTKAFAPPAMAVGDLSLLTLTIDNSGSTAPITGIDVTDNLPVGVTLATPAAGAATCTGGTLTAVDGGSVLSYSGGALAAGTTCTVTANVTSALGGSYLNTTGNLSSSAGSSGPASATLQVSTRPLFSKQFSPAAMFLGQSSRLVLSIDHNAGTLPADLLAVTDNLPAGLLLATPANASNSCGGTLTAPDGGGSLSLSGGLVAAGASCTVEADVVSANAGLFANLSGDLTSSLGNSEPASADLQVDPVPGLSKAFAPTQAFVGQSSTVTLAIDNSASLQALSGVTLSDALPAGLQIATPANASNSCGGALSAPAGGSTVTLSGGGVAAGASCTIGFDVLAVSAGTLLNTTSTLQSNAGSVAAASDTLLVDPVPLLSKRFDPGAVAVDAVSQLSIDVDNSGSATALTGLAITDNLPAGLTLATPANASTDCAGGTLTAADGGSVISYSGGGLAAGASCSIVADVRSATPGSYVNTTGDLTSNAGNGGTASATLVVSSRPLLGKQFSPAAGFVNLPVRLILSVDHSAGALPATALDLTDPLPAGLVIATPANAVTSCSGGTLTATAGTGSLSYSGGSVAAGASCMIEVDVVAAAAGDYLNTTGDLLSSLGNSGSASASLRIDAAPSLGKAFAPIQIFVGQTSTVTLSIDNSSSQQAVGGLAITDSLPAGLLLASQPAANNTCGGALQAVAGSSSVTLNGGSVSAGSSCAINFDVVASSSGSLLNTTSMLTTDAGAVPPASASLQVEPQPMLNKAFAPTQIFVGGQASVVLTIDNPGALPLTNVALTDDLPIGLLLTASPNAQTDCGGTLTAGAGAATVSLNSGALVAGGSCSISFDVQASVVGDLTNTTAPLQSSAGGTPTATATLRVNPVPAFSKRFEPELILADQITTVILTIDNSASTLPVTGLSFSDDLPSSMFVAAPSNAAQDCGAGTLIATSGATLVGYSGGSVAAGAICTVRFDVGVMSEGLFDNVAGPLQTDVGLGDAAATARLTASPGAMPVPLLGQRAIWLLMVLMLALGLLGLRQRSG